MMPWTYVALPADFAILIGIFFPATYPPPPLGMPSQSSTLSVWVTGGVLAAMVTPLQAGPPSTACTTGMDRFCASGANWPTGDVCVASARKQGWALPFIAALSRSAAGTEVEWRCCMDPFIPLTHAH